jgi:hypothetical protein
LKTTCPERTRLWTPALPALQYDDLDKDKRLHVQAVVAWNVAEGVAATQLAYQKLNRLQGDFSGENLLVEVRHCLQLVPGFE